MLFNVHHNKKNNKNKTAQQGETIAKPMTDKQRRQQQERLRKELDGIIQRVRGTSVLSLEEHLPSERGNDILEQRRIESGDEFGDRG